jgi:hypothetical protein
VLKSINIFTGVERLSYTDVYCFIHGDIRKEGREFSRNMETGVAFLRAEAHQQPLGSAPAVCSNPPA